MQKLNLVLGLGTLILGNAAFAANGDRSGGPLATLDSNEDGVVDFVEFQENSEDPVARLDADGDSLVSLDEFLDGRPNRGSRRGGFGGQRSGAPELSDEEIAEFQEMMLERATEQFGAMDLDGNGLVSTIEMQEASFLRMDDDGDGVLSAQELRRRHHGGPGRGGHRGRPGQRSGGQSDQEL